MAAAQNILMGRDRWLAGEKDRLFRAIRAIEGQMRPIRLRQTQRANERRAGMRHSPVERMRDQVELGHLLRRSDQERTALYVVAREMQQRRF